MKIIKNLTTENLIFKTIAKIYYLKKTLKITKNHEIKKIIS